ncbi:MAG TPA: YqgE/AlgH family protein [Chitinophagaceae bacterium]|nr:YqgE/AlgH family protein [Chitinophagaceae bacterium]
MISPAKGTLLIANPFLKDPNFVRSVIFLCEHKEEGSFGFVLNKKFHQTLGELIPELAEQKIPVYYGGPVQKNTIHFLHQYPDLIPGGEEVLDGIFWGGNFESLISYVKNDDIDFNKIRFFIGYSGWSEGQLNGEMEEKSWLTVDAIKKLIFHKNPEEIWKDSLKHLGGDYEMMINFPLDPQLN